MRGMMCDQELWNKAIDMLIETKAFDCEQSGVEIDNRIIKLVAALLARHNALEARIKQINVRYECDKCECLFIPGGKGSETTCATCIKEDLNALKDAARPVVAACRAADEDSELDDRIGGEMLFKLAALVGEEGND